MWEGSVKVYVLNIDGAKCAFVESDLNIMLEDIKYMTEGDKAEIEICDMTQEEIDAMPEFEGY